MNYDRFDSREDAPEWLAGAFAEGEDARAHDVPESECPYSADEGYGFARKSWRAGWADMDMSLRAEFPMVPGADERLSHQGTP